MSLENPEIELLVNSVDFNVCVWTCPHCGQLVGPNVVHVCSVLEQKNKELIEEIRVRRIVRDELDKLGLIKNESTS